MKRVFFTFLSAAAVCAFVAATPTLAATAPGVSGTAAASGAAATAGAPAPGVSGTAAASGAAATGTAATSAGAPAPGVGNGNDARAQAAQAEDHPEMADQVPAWTPPGGAVGEVYPHGRSYGYGPAAMVTAPFDAATALVAAPFDAAEAYVAPPSHAARTHTRCHVTRDFYGSDGRLTSVCRF
jgi:hypothetical protein